MIFLEALETDLALRHEMLVLVVAASSNIFRRETLKGGFFLSLACLSLNEGTSETMLICDQSCFWKTTVTQKTGGKSDFRSSILVMITHRWSISMDRKQQ